MSEVDIPTRLLRYGAKLCVDGVPTCKEALVEETAKRKPVREGLADFDADRLLAQINNERIDLRRVALREEDLVGLPSFDVETKRGDPRYQWYRRTTGKTRAWELDAMSPPDLSPL
jgi:hypothetical protein